jgi:hypothetical protein
MENEMNKQTIYAIKHVYSNLFLNFNYDQRDFVKLCNFIEYSNYGETLEHAQDDIKFILESDYRYNEHDLKIVKLTITMVEEDV